MSHPFKKLFTKKLTQETIDSWITPAGVSGSNCVETALSFINVVSREECARFSIERTPRSTDEISTEITNRAKETYNIDTPRIFNINSLDNFKESIKKKIGNGNATLVLLYRPGAIGHAVVIGVNDSNELTLYDPQTRQKPSSNRELTDYLRAGGYLDANGQFQISVAESLKRKRSNSNSNSNSNQRRSKKGRYNSNRSRKRSNSNSNSKLTTGSRKRKGSNSSYNRRRRVKLSTKQDRK
jgi:hypothetical protein